MDHGRVGVCYARVSSTSRSSPSARGGPCGQDDDHQKEMLQRQIDLMRKSYPNYEVVTDVGSALDWGGDERPGFGALLDRVMRGQVSTVVVTRRDRLCRYAFDLVKRVFERSGCKLVVYCEKTRNDKGGIASADDDEESLDAELRDDLYAVVTMLVASGNGRRAASRRRERRKGREAEPVCQKSTQEDVSLGGSTVEGGHRPQVAGYQDEEIQAAPYQGAAGHPQAVVGCHQVDIQQGGKKTQPQAEGYQSDVGVAAGVGEYREYRVEEPIRKRTAEVLAGSVSYTGFSYQRRGGGVCRVESQGEDTSPRVEIPPEKRLHVIVHGGQEGTELFERDCRSMA